MSDARLNRQMLAELRAVMEDEFNLLLETFFADTEQRLEAIQAGLDEGKAEDFSRACHSLKGSASNLGLEQLRVLCKQGEDLGRQGSLEGAAAIVTRIRQEVSELEPLLRAEMAES